MKCHVKVYLLYLSKKVMMYPASQVKMINDRANFVNFIFILYSFVFSGKIN